MKLQLIELNCHNFYSNLIFHAQNFHRIRLYVVQVMILFRVTNTEKEDLDKLVHSMDDMATRSRNIQSLMFETIDDIDRLVKIFNDSIFIVYEAVRPGK